MKPARTSLKEKIQMLVRIEMEKHYPGLDFVDDTNGELFFDQFSERYFRSTKSKLLWTSGFMNRELHMSGECSLNEYYILIGLTPLAKDTVWRLDDGYVWIDFNYTYVDHEDEYEDYYIVSILSESMFM